MEQNQPINLTTLVDAFAEPHALYTQLRKQESVYYDAESQSWLVTGHAAVMQILTDARFTAALSTIHGTTQHSTATPSFLEKSINKMIIFTDAEIHRQFQAVILRKLGEMNKALPSFIRATAQQLLAEITGEPEFELVEDFAYPFSLIVIAKVLGVPTDDRERLLALAAWSDSHGHFSSGHLQIDLADINRLGDYFRALIAEKRRDPGDDLISALLETDLFADEDDLVVNCMMVFGAGRMTTQKLLANGLPLLLAQWPVWRSALQDQAKLAEQLTEELLRTVTPTRYITREATEDVELNNTFPGATGTIRAGEKVALFLEAANYDPAIFAQPQSFTPERNPNRHLAFGYGPHFCAGARLARLEIQLALESLFAVFAELYPDPELGPLWSPNPNLGGYEEYLTCPVYHE